MNLGKSRNDQVATALRMECRDMIIATCSKLISLQETLATIVRKHSGTPFPGYTHLQHAQPITLGHHFQSYLHALQRDVERLTQAYSRLNRSPMGLAALAGTSVRIDRERISRLLGFEGLVRNSVDGVSSRDFVAELLFSAQIVMIDLSRIAEEVILWSSSEFGYVEVADEYAATSSIMPQKKNPVVAETVRAKCSTSLGHLAAVCGLLRALPNSYNLDLQEATPHLWASLRDTKESVEMMTGMLSSLNFRVERIEESLQDDKSTATELANYLVTREGLPFREAHAVVGELVWRSLNKKISLVDAASEYLPEVSSSLVGRELKIDKASLRNVLDVRKTLARIRSNGGANPRLTIAELSKDRNLISENKGWVRKKSNALEEADRLLENQVQLYIDGVKN
jgi:argininosuccinate lyase